MPKRRGKFVLSSAEEAQLQQLIRAQSTPQGLAQRARVVQLAAQGMGVRAIGGRVGMHYNQVAKWRRRYMSNDNYNSFSGDSYFSRLFWVKSARFFLVFSWFGFLLSLAPAFGRRGVAAEGRRQRRAEGGILRA